MRRPTSLAASLGLLTLSCLSPLAGTVASPAAPISTSPVSSAAPPFELPAPTGSSPIGTTAWRVTDPARRETFGDEKGFRQVEVLAWYPAAAAAAAPAASGARAPYLREGLAEVASFAKRLGSPSAFDGLLQVRTHAALDAKPAAAPRTFPVLVFSHGFTAAPSSYTALLEDLASQGYVVLSVVHPYEAAAATLDHGRVVTMLDANGELRPSLRQVLGEWATEDATMAEVTRQTDDESRLRILRTYLAGLHQTNETLRRWVDDTALVLDQLAAHPPALLAGRLDLDHVGVLGHSMGGVTAGQFCAQDRRCQAGLNLDGIPQYGTMLDHSLKRPFLMVYSARPGRTGASDAIYRRGASPYLRVDVRDTLHLDFSDMVLWGGPLRERPILGKLAPQRAIDITREVVREFFDQQLRGRKSKLLAGEETVPEVKVQAQP